MKRPREIIKLIAHGIAWLLVTPSALSFGARCLLLGRDRALEGSTQAWALVPGLMGQYLRRAFLSRSIRSCARSATVEFGTVLSSASAVIGERVYIGPGCHLGWVEIEQDALLASGVHVPSGRHTHGTSDLGRPIRDQPITKLPVRIGAGSWIGSGAIIMADIGRDTVVGAGAVVTHALPDRIVAAGVPARVLYPRQG